MAAEVSSMPSVNGYAPHQGYGGLEQHQQQHGSNGFTHNNISSANAQAQYGQQQPANSSTPATTSSQQSDIPKDEVGWYFVEQYYTTLSRSPEKLYLFYNKRSQFVSGQETDKVAVCVGQRAINDRIKELDFQDCKVRVTNVDSQASDANIVIQVIGEISNKSQAHKKFTQTFVLATQTNGYFVLNDIFRYLIEEEDEAEAEPEAEIEAPAPSAQEEVKPVPGVESGAQEPPPTTEEAEPKTLTSSLNPTAVEHDAQAVDKELKEKVLKEPAKSKDTPAPAVNGASEPEQEDATSTQEAAAATPAELDGAPANDLEPVATEEADVKPEAPKDPEPTPAVSPPKQTAPQPAAPAKPAVPKTWASLAASAHRVATPATPSAPSSASQPRPTQSTAPSASSIPKAATPTPSATATSAPTAPAAQREEPASAQDEWNTVGGSHNRQQSRQAAQQPEQAPQTRGYIKNVREHVDGADLKAHLDQFGEIVYFDIAPQKNCAFVDYKHPDGYNAAVAANPHSIGTDKLYVEERRIRPGSNAFVPRGQFQGGRGGRGGASGQGAPRGNFQGGGRGGYAPRGGRGGAPGGAPAIGRGGRGGATGGAPSA